MDNIKDIYAKKPEQIKSFLGEDVIISLKIDGKPFQVSYDSDYDLVEYRGRSGNSVKLGPLLTEYDLIFSTGLNKGIKHFEQHKDAIKNYKFICCEVSDGDEIYLLSCVNNNDTFIDDNKTLSKVSKELHIDTIPVLFEGKLSDKCKEEIIAFIEEKKVPKAAEFKQWIIDTFDLSKSDIKELKTLDEFEGIVFNFNPDSSKPTQYKLVDPVIAERRTERDAMLKKQNAEHAEAYDEAYKYLFEIAQQYKNVYDTDHWKNMNLMFEEFCKHKDILNKLCEISKTLITNTRYRCFIQQERLSKTLQTLFKEHKELLNIYETYIKMFYKAKPRAFVISKEFQSKVNTFINNMENVNEHLTLKDYITENIDKNITTLNMKSIKDIITESRHKEWTYVFNFYKGPWDKNDPSKNLIDTIEYKGGKLTNYAEHFKAYEDAWLSKHDKSEGMPGKGIGVTVTLVNTEWVK